MRVIRTIEDTPPKVGDLVIVFMSEVQGFGRFWNDDSVFLGRVSIFSQFLESWLVEIQKFDTSKLQPLVFGKDRGSSVLFVFDGDDIARWKKHTDAAFKQTCESTTAHHAFLLNAIAMGLQP